MDKPLAFILDGADGNNVVNKNVQRLGSEQIQAILSPRVPNSFEQKSTTENLCMTSPYSGMSTERLQEELKKNPRKRNMLNAYKERFNTLTPKQLQIGIALMLGDGSLQTQNAGKTYRIKFEQGEKNLDYLNHLYSEFSEWCLSKPRKQARTNKAGNSVITWAFQTISHSAFVPLVTLFLRKTHPFEKMPRAKSNKPRKAYRKALTKDFVQNHVTHTVMAYWFMDDGGKLDYTKNEGKGLVFNSHNFSEEENDYLVEGLTSKFGLNCWKKTNKGKYVVAISGDNFSQMMEMMGDFIISSMRYKLPSLRRHQIEIAKLS